MLRLNPAVLPLRPPRRPLAALIILLLAAALSACAAPDPVLTGTIKDAYTGAPISAASVQVGETTVTTDANGVFKAPSWRKTDTLAVTAPDYEPVALPLEAQPQIAASGTLTITLDTALRPNTLRGVVSDTFSGRPLAGADLAITVDISTTLRAQSAADGSYSFEGVPEQFSLAVSAPDHAPVAEQLSRTTSYSPALRPDVLAGQVTDRFSGGPVAGAIVTVGAAKATTDAEGRYKVVGIAEGEQTVEIVADGYAPLSEEIGQTTSLDSVLRPDTLRGRLIDKGTGAPIANATLIATATLPGTDVAYTQVKGSSDGSFTLKGLPEQGYLQVLSPGYAKQVIEIKPGNLPSEIALDRFTVKALYVTAAVASSSKALQEYIDLIDTTELNTIIIDIKSDLRDDLGMVYYDSQVPLAKELGLSRDYIDMRGLVQSLRAKGIYTIARVQLFSHDNVLADARPDWAIHLKETGEVFADYPGPGIRYAYLDPTNRNVWDYNIQLGVEAAMMGFDEINYDYIRFPDWYGDKASFRDTLQFSVPIDPVDNPDLMFNTLTEFMQQAHRAVNGAGAYMSIDVFGRVVLGPSMTIAQDIGRMGAYTDYIAPMVYPSLWWPGAFGLDSPVDEPAAVLNAANTAGVAQIQDQYARLRPWLQDHTDPWAYKVVQYGPSQVRAQIDATEQFSQIDGWMLYDSANAYRGAFGGAVKPER
ncbi:carboxypeptidase regulatory-like domain-containing protein [Oscillochloris sp. ZM17-4]|uniref:putative glycoside hydrolase n=1 Tax=Oscillochloris sp. ZM17-4 TaxID=2866714 RepID=UPI001C72B4E2|nr:putative glycoside hydrolase [Oscillochloris sp. ZM17-4]MBX0328148.1 carboxypeptidase regulatory-like domain-containing protein [Oscillochloris sp. ZM17-4]